MEECKIKANEYIRTVEGEILKVTDTDVGETPKGDVQLIELDKKEYTEIGSWIKKHSFDKIDLLQVGDLIFYKCININSDKLELDIIKDEVDLQDYKNRFKSNFWQLVSFVTKQKLNKEKIQKLKEELKWLEN